MERDQLITALKSLLSAAEREFDTKRCRDSSLKALFAARKVLRSVAAAAPAVPSEAEIEAWSTMLCKANNEGKPGIIDACRREAVAMMRRAAGGAS